MHRHTPQPTYVVALLLIVAIAVLALPAHAQSCATDQEPNDTPAEATPLDWAAGCIEGELAGDDQDAFQWVVPDDRAETTWTFDIEGIPDQLTRVQVLRVQFADNGTDVEDYTDLYSFGTTDGSRRTFENVLFEPGTYVLGVSKSGGEGDYRVEIREHGTLPAAGDEEPNDGFDETTPVEGGFDLSGDLQESNDYYTWSLSEQDAEKRWQLEAQAPAGRRLQVALYNAEEQRLATAKAGDDGRALLNDVGLDAGSYVLKVDPEYEEVVRYRLSVTPTGDRAADLEDEPNDNFEIANDVDLTEGVTGRLAGDDTYDVYHFTLDERLARRTLELTFDTESAERRTICLLSSDGSQNLQCRDGVGEIKLVDLVLDAGDYGLEVKGRGDADNPYTISLDSAGRPSEDYEAEPNDRVEFATPLNEQNAIQGRFVGQEDDFFRFVIDDEEPQLWRIQAIGDGISQLAYYDGAGQQQLEFRTRGDQRRVRLSNLFLLPGEHAIRVSGRDGDYSVRAIPIGPPDPGAELEPNDDLSQAHKLRFDTPRTGLLEESSDRDYYRFFLPTKQHVVLHITPPADMRIAFDLRGHSFVTSGDPGVAGEPIVYETVLDAGDYELQVWPVETSDAPYEIVLERRDPFLVPATVEPNDRPYQARQLPPSLDVSGHVGRYYHNDWYVLPTPTEDTGLTVADPYERTVRYYDENQNELRDEFVWDDETRTYSTTVPAGATRYVRVEGTGPYHLSFDFENGPAPERVNTPLDSLPARSMLAPIANALRQVQAVQGAPLALSLTFETEEVAAYWVQGQQIRGGLTLENAGTESLNLTLEAVASHFAWTPILAETSVSLEAGERTTVPVTVEVAPDAWADEPVFVTVAARTDDGQQRTVEAELHAGRETPPVNPRQTWPLPEELLGGVNVAWSALGAQIRTENEDYAESQVDLHDEITPLQDGFRGRGADAPITLTVELAGDGAVPVAGFTLNPMGDGRGGESLHAFDLALSEDGDTYEVAYSGELSSQPVEQAFVLSDTTPARFAQLRMRSNHQYNEGSIRLGEWKVIAAPGQAIAGTQGLNLANPDLGGHIVWYDPQMRGLANMLSAEDEATTTRLSAGERAEWVIGFQHERAAQITELQWRDASDRNVENDITEVDVWVSMESPVGPWESLGTWQLDRAAAGDAGMTFTLDAPVWARYIRFRTSPVEERMRRNFPATLRIIERPVGDGYASALGEWGHYNRDAVYEWLHPVILTPPALTEDDNDTRDTADTLALNEERAGQVQIEQDEDWFALDVPDGQNTLAFGVMGDPTVGVRLRLENDAGDEVPLRTETAAPKRQLLKATVEPGEMYYLRVEEPPRSVVFSWDTSASVNPYTSIIYNALSSFAGDVSPGREVVNFLPFGGDVLLEEWGTEPYLLRQTLNNYDRSDNSSSAEVALLQATDELAPRAGTKAIIFITDAASPSADKTAELWRALHEVQPRIFALAISSAGAFGGNPPYEQDLMETWSAVNGGHYDYLRSQGALEIGFDRAATWLRRPARYVISATAGFEEPPGPGTLQLFGGETDEGDTESPALQSGAVELILDASGSMLQQMDGGRRIDVAKDVLIDLTTNTLPEGTPLALRVFGHKESGTCRTDLEIPLQPLDPPALQSTLADITAQNLAKTPIADSLRLVADDLAGADENTQRTVVLVTDGEETCEGDPGAAIQFLKDEGIDVRVNIVGFAIADEVLKQQFRRWAELGGGQYFDATGAEELGESIERALRVPFRVRNSDGDVVAEGVVDGQPVEVPAGVYTVEVLTEPAQTYSDVQIGGDEAVQLAVTP